MGVSIKLPLLALALITRQVWTGAVTEGLEKALRYAADEAKTRRDGEESYAAMRRSTNGGGENSPLLNWEDDAYEMFMAEIAMLDD